MVIDKRQDKKILWDWGSDNLKNKVSATCGPLGHWPAYHGPSANIDQAFSISYHTCNSLTKYHSWKYDKLVKLCAFTKRA